MLKIIFLAAFLFFTSILLVPNAALSSPLLHGTFISVQTSVTSPPSEATPSSKPATPQASESSQTERKRTPLDSIAPAPEVESKEVPTSSKSSNTQSESGGPYDMESIKAFNRALYGS
jgi:hypothetical protein